MGVFSIHFSPLPPPTSLSLSLSLFLPQTKTRKTKRPPGHRLLLTNAVGPQIRNIQLGGIGFIAALAASLWKDGAAIKAAGFFQVRSNFFCIILPISGRCWLPDLSKLSQGYTPLVWSVVGQVGCGGLLVALVSLVPQALIMNTFKHPNIQAAKQPSSQDTSAKSLDSDS
jgi:hypothetical protein